MIYALSKTLFGKGRFDCFSKTTSKMHREWTKRRSLINFFFSVRSWKVVCLCEAKIVQLYCHILLLRGEISNCLIISTNPGYTCFIAELWCTTCATNLDISPEFQILVAIKISHSFHDFNKILQYVREHPWYVAIKFL